MDKRQRSYSLEVMDQDGHIIKIAPPFTIEFDVLRNKLSSANVAKIRIYNLKEMTRNRILKNPNVGDFRTIKLFAGYGNNIPQILYGNITQAWSVREGTNFITEIECFDAGYAFTSAEMSKTFPSGTAYQTVIETLAKGLNDFGVGVGAIGNFSWMGSLKRAASFSGSIIDNLRTITNGRVFIDSGRIFILNDGEAIAGEVQLVNSNYGLLNTPVRHETYLNFDMLFEPRLVIGQALRVESATARNYNGNYTVFSIHHKGMVSESVAGSATTQVGCLGEDAQTIKQLIGVG